MKRSEVRGVWWAQVGQPMEVSRALAERWGAVVVECYRDHGSDEFEERFRSDIRNAKILRSQGAQCWAQYRPMAAKYDHGVLHDRLLEMRAEGLEVDGVFIDDEVGMTVGIDRTRAWRVGTFHAVEATIESALPARPTIIWYNAGNPHEVPRSDELRYDAFNESLYTTNDAPLNRRKAERLWTRYYDHWVRTRYYTPLMFHVSPGLHWENGDVSIAGANKTRRVATMLRDQMGAKVELLGVWPSIWRPEGASNLYQDAGYRDWEHALVAHDEFLDQWGEEGSWLSTNEETPNVPTT